MKEKKYQFERLTPIDNMDLGVYEEAIDYIFDNNDIKNVAISGAYSAGKSSVLASYKKKHSDKKFLHISLAHFKSTDQENEMEVKESILEGKILNQLIHQIPSEKIPQTNFRVKKKVDKESVIKLTTKIVIFIIMTIYFACFDIWENYVSTLPDNGFKSILTLSTHQYALMLDGILIVALLSFNVYGFIIMQKNKNIFRKLNLQGNEIEIFEECDDSYFDKYLNEILYLFENAEADVIVFEDMDRFNAMKIFERLREVNMLANIQLQKEDKKVLRFFYLLRDDIFDSKDRTKFFDYIIPVVPVVDSSNSYDKFILYFKKSGFLENFEKNFLQGLSLYIDDMRILKNIYNEFIIYYNRLNFIELDCNKMLAIISYKNLFPYDFANLQLNQGFVYTIFNRKDIFIKKLDEQIDKNYDAIEKAKKEHINSIAELNLIKRYSLSNGLGNMSDSDYNKRKHIIDNKLNNITKLEKENVFLKQKKFDIQNKKIYEIITRDNIDTIFNITSKNDIGEISNFNEVKSNEYFDLLKYLIRNGYLDETYSDYMTYFYENSLSRIDKIFLRSITDKKAKEYTYKLKNPKLVVSRLRLIDFDQEETLNFDLLTYLLQTSCIDYTNRLIDQLKNTKNFKFIGGYFDITTELQNYIQNLNERWPECFFTALNENSLNNTQLYRYSILTLYNSKDDIIKCINKDNCLCNYISNNRDYLVINEPEIDKLINCFILLNVCFIGFNYKKINKDLFNAIYEKSLYQINEENLYLIIREILKEKNENDFINKNYTILCSHSESAITQYVNQNINEYFDVILQISRGTILDDEKVAVIVLNNSKLTTEHKQSYISSLKTTITSIKKIEDSSLWGSLLNAEIVQYSEYNIMDCFNTMKLNNSVIDYINKCDIDLDFSKTEYDEDTKGKLFDSIVTCNDINNLQYKQILESLNFCYDNFDLEDISHDKITILIDTNIIKMTTENLIFMRENYPNKKNCFIQKNLEKYIEIMDYDLLEQEELLAILNWNIDDEQKIKLLEHTDEEISIIEKNYSPRLCLYILNNNVTDSDLPILFSSFEQLDNAVKNKVLEYAEENIVDIIDNPNCASDELKDKLLSSNNVSRDEKIDLFIAIMPSIEENKIKDILSLLNLENYIKIFNPKKRPTFEINDENDKLLTAFMNKNIIKNFEESNTKKGYYKIIRNN